MARGHAHALVQDLLHLRRRDRPWGWVVVGRLNRHRYVRVYASKAPCPSWQSNHICKRTDVELEEAVPEGARQGLAAAVGPARRVLRREEAEGRVRADDFLGVGCLWLGFRDGARVLIMFSRTLINAHTR